MFGSQSKSWGWQLYLQSSSEPQRASRGLSGSHWPRQCYPCVSCGLRDRKSPFHHEMATPAGSGRESFSSGSFQCVLSAYFGIRGDKVFFQPTNPFCPCCIPSFLNFIYFHLRQSLRDQNPIFIFWSTQPLWAWRYLHIFSNFSKQECDHCIISLSGGPGGNVCVYLRLAVNTSQEEHAPNPFMSEQMCDNNFLKEADRVWVRC